MSNFDIDHSLVCNLVVQFDEFVMILPIRLFYQTN